MRYLSGSQSAAVKQTYLIGRWRFDPDEPVLRSEDAECRLEHRAARTLELLCQRRGDVVSKAELLDTVWGARSVSANSVAIVIGDLRRALEDDPRAPTHIVTINKRGYRLTESRAPAALADRAPARRAWLRAPLAGAVLAAGALSVLSLGLLSFSRSPVELLVEPTRNATGRADYDPLARSLSAVVVDRASRFHGVRALTATSASSNGRYLVLNSQLILWGGAPELAMTATDARTHAVVWSGFAGGPPGSLARSAASRLATLQVRLAR